MKVAVSTYCERDSYGSVLQAYALKSVLQELGCDSFLVKTDSKTDRKLKIRFPKTPGQCIIQAVNILKKRCIEKRYNRTLDFIEHSFETTYYPTQEDLQNNPPEADVYLAGSDQIWHPGLCREDFFLDYAPKEKRRISYAASMGITKIPSRKEEQFAKLIRNFDTLSVRESECKTVISSFTDREVAVHVDPTILWNREFWERIETPYSIKGEYILVYAIYWNEASNESLKRLHKKTGLKIVAICNEWSKLYANHHLYDVGPREFLWLIHHASAVVTSSFHGSVFATIYHKKASIIVNPQSPSRLEELMNRLKIINSEIEKVMEQDEQAYIAVDQRIQEERKRSMEYLKKVLFDVAEH